jgi:hypothetical protein
MNSYGYMRTFKIFKEFIDNIYGSVRDYIEFAKTNQLLKIEKMVIEKVSRTKKTKDARPDVLWLSFEEVDRYLLAWEQLENYALQESALNKLFYQTYSDNKDIDDVLIKVSILNDFYSTTILSPLK